MRCPDGSCAIARANDGAMSQREVARVFGLTFQTIQWIELRALRKLRAKLRDWGPV